MPYNAEQNQQNNQNQDPNKQQGDAPVNLSGSPGSTPAGNSGRVATFSNGQTQSAGSGRYTNLQKYIGANQGATDHLYQGITNRIDQTAQPKQQEAQTQAQKVKEGIDQGNQAIQRGTGYYNQMQDQGFNAQNFAADQNRLDDYSKFRTGTAVDQNALSTQNNNAQTATMQAQDAYNQRLGQVGNEAGRFDLLKETFGGREAYKPTYSAGQQRLDQLFLQSGAGNKVGAIQDQLRGNVNQLGQNLAGLQGQTAQAITGLGTQQSQLAGNIQGKANNLESGYINDIQSQVGGVNTGRDAERTRYNDFVKQILASGQGKETSQALDSDIFNESQLQNGEQVFNAFKNPTLTSEQFQNIDTRNANDYHDIANKQNVDYYGALSKLAGIDNSKLSQTGMLVDPATGQLTKAASLKQGEGGLRNTVDNAQNDFIKNAMNTVITGQGTDSGSTGVFGGGGDASATISQNLGDYLKSSGYLTQSGVVPKDNYGTAGLYGAAPQTAFNGDILGRLLGGGGLTSGLGDALAGVTGSSSGSQSAAQFRAKNDLIGQLGSTLANQGYNNYITSSGVKNTNDIANKMTGAEQDRLDITSRDRYSNLDSPEGAKTAGQNALTQFIHGQGNDQQLAANLNDYVSKNSYDDFTKQAQAGTIDPKSLDGLQQYYNAYNGVNDQNAGLKSELAGKLASVDASKNSAMEEMKQRLGIGSFNTAPSIVKVPGQNDIKLNDIPGDVMTPQQRMAQRFAGK